MQSTDAIFGHPDGTAQRARVAVAACVGDAVFQLPEGVPAILYDFVAQRLPLPSPPTIRVFLEIPHIRDRCHRMSDSERTVLFGYSNARCFAPTAAGALQTALNVQRSGASVHELVTLS